MIPRVRTTILSPIFLRHVFSLRSGDDDLSWCYYHRSLLAYSSPFLYSLPIPCPHSEIAFFSLPYHNINTNSLPVFSTVRGARRGWRVTAQNTGRNRMAK